MLSSVRINDLSFYNDLGTVVLSAKQYDTGRKFVFKIIENDEPFDLTGCSVNLRMLKADNTEFQSTECCVIDGNTITIDTSLGNGNQILASAGKNRGELHLTDSNGLTMTTWDFIIEVAERVHKGDAFESTDSWDTLDEIENTLGEINSDIEVLQLHMITSVKTFGAVGDGVTNDTEAIKQAAAYGKAVYFPAGTYLLYEQIDQTTDIIWYGDGESSIIKLVPYDQARPEEYEGKTVYNTYMISHEGSSNTTGHELTLRNLVLDASKDDYNSDILGNGSSRYDHTVALDIQYPSKIYMDNVVIKNALIEGCYILNNDSPVTIVNCKFRDNGYYQEDASGLHLEGNHHNTLVSNCTFTNNGFNGLLLGGTFGANISNITCNGNGFDGVMIWGGASKNRLSNVYSFNNRAGLTMKSAYSASELDIYEDWMIYANDNLISNISTESNTYGIIFGNCTNNCISNWISENDDYSYCLSYTNEETREISGKIDNYKLFPSIAEKTNFTDEEQFDRFVVEWKDEQISSIQTKLDGIEENANNYVHPDTSGNRHIPSGGSTGQVVTWLSDGEGIWSDVEANTLASIELTDADLDIILPDTVMFYYAAGGNTCANNPEDGKSFGMYCYKNASGYRCQELYSQTGNKYIRFYNSSVWSDWEQIATTNSNVVSATQLQTARKINGVSFNGTSDIYLPSGRRWFVGSNSASTSGWYKFLTVTLGVNESTHFVLSVTNMYANLFHGIVWISLRGGSSATIETNASYINWMYRNGFSTTDIIAVANGSTVDFYIYQPRSQYGSIMFQVISEGNRVGGVSYTTYAYGGTPETTQPTATITSKDGGIVLRATQDGSGNVITDTYLPLAGGTMDAGASLIIPYSSDARYVKYDSGGVKHYLPTGGFAMGDTFYTQDGTNLGGIGAHGEANAIKYYYIGVYNNPLLKVDTSGNVVSKGNYISTGGKTTQIDGVNGSYLGLGNLELSADTPFIDFHYNNSTADYTARIINDTATTLDLKASGGVKENGTLLSNKYVSTKIAPSYATLQAFVEATSSNDAKTWGFRFKDTGGWTPWAGWWQCWVQYQNGYNQTSYDVGGNVLLMCSSTGTFYKGFIKGKNGSYTVTWSKIDFGGTVVWENAGSNVEGTSVTINGSGYSKFEVISKYNMTVINTGGTSGTTYTTTSSFLTTGVLPFGRTIVDCGYCSTTYTVSETNITFGSVSCSITSANPLYTLVPYQVILYP